MNYYNKEGYADSTAFKALNRIQKEEAQKKYRPLVYICSPFSHGDVNKNILNARKYSRFAVDNNCIPITPHLLFPQYMDDSIPEERELAMFMNHVLLGKCEELWVFGNIRSPGMKQEIKWAVQKHMKIRYISDFERSTEDV